MIWMPSDAMDDPLAIFYSPNFDPDMLDMDKEDALLEAYDVCPELEASATIIND